LIVNYVGYSDKTTVVRQTHVVRKIFFGVLSSTSSTSLQAQTSTPAFSIHSCLSKNSKHGNDNAFYNARNSDSVLSVWYNDQSECSQSMWRLFGSRNGVSRGPGGGPLVIKQCRRCRRFARTEKHYEEMEPESPELLALCLKQIPALSSNQQPKMHLADAMWIWTEPHSMRFKLRLTIRTEMQNVRIQQLLAVELVNQVPVHGSSFQPVNRNQLSG